MNTHLAAFQVELADGTRTCRDPSPTWCSTSPLSPVTTDRRACTCLDCLRAEASAAARTVDLVIEERNRLREVAREAAVIVAWVHDGPGQERAPRTVLAACRRVRPLLPRVEPDLDLDQARGAA